jgi:4-coumarate--CoA ligase
MFLHEYRLCSVFKLVFPHNQRSLPVADPLIADAAVIGVPDPDGSGNELPRAYVVADRAKIDEAAIKDHVKKNAAHCKQLREGVVWLDAIPKTASGKILCKDLREMARSERRTGAED